MDEIRKTNKIGIGVGRGPPGFRVVQLVVIPGLTNLHHEILTKNLHHHVFCACKCRIFLYAYFTSYVSKIRIIPGIRQCGCSSGVERYLAKVEVESSNLFTRSIFVSFISSHRFFVLYKIVKS